MVFQPVVAGRFYPGNSKELAAQVDGYIEKAVVADIQGDVWGIVSPHAGYVYSGPVAGYAFNPVKGKTFDVVVVIGLSHRVPGTVSVLDYDAYQTPIDIVPIDRELSRKLADAAPWIDANEGMFSQEHSLEVQLPFIQRAIKDPKIVMVSMRSQGLKRCSELARILDETFAGKRTLFVASSDMSHFHPYDKANKMDLATLDLIDAMKVEDLARGFESGQCEMCGSGPVLTLMELHRRRGGTADGIKVLKYLNSADTAGSKGEVVGYGAVAFVQSRETDKGKQADATGEQSEDYLSGKDKKTLLGIARQTVETYVKTGKKPDINIESDALKQPGAAFVTLHKKGQLRGCIGQIIARMPLWECVQEMAVAAATQDPRFSKVGTSELPDLHIEVSVLTPPKVLDDPSKVEVGRHGLIMSRGFQRGLLLPQVPVEWKWDRETFLKQTCNKAGMSTDCWKDPKTKIETFEAIVFSEQTKP